jgi:kumamolisin
VHVTVTLRGPALPEPEPGESISREELAEAYGADQHDIDKTKEVLEGYGLDVTEEPAATRSLRVSGTAAQMEEAFRAALGVYHDPEQGEFRGREGRLQVPAELADVVTGVFGLDERRVARRSAVVETAAGPTTTPLGPAELEQHYNFPPGEAAGQTIAIAEFGGGYFPGDLEAFCERHGRPVPDVTTVPVGLQPLTLDDIRQLPTSQRRVALLESLEVMMDVEIIAGLCPQAKIFVYFAPFDQRGWIDLLNRVIAGTPASPVTLSVSWGLAEDAPDWSAGALDAINERLKAAALLGITVCLASGDDGSGDQMRDNRAHVNFPATSPYVLGVGGTMLDQDGEVVWWEAPGERTQQGGGSTGGGVSDHFDRPSWQTVHIASLNPGSIDGRIVPDVAALAGPPSYDMTFLGQPFPGGGTSASAPLWASLIARMIENGASHGRPVFLTPLLYQKGPDGRVRGESCFVDVTVGNNTSPKPGQGYKATAGYDAVSGWGLPDGRELLASL